MFVKNKIFKWHDTNLKAGIHYCGELTKRLIKIFLGNGVLQTAWMLLCITYSFPLMSRYQINICCSHNLTQADLSVHQVLLLQYGKLILSN